MDSMHLLRLIVLGLMLLPISLSAAVFKDEHNTLIINHQDSVLTYNESEYKYLDKVAYRYSLHNPIVKFYCVDDANRAWLIELTIYKTKIKVRRTIIIYK